MHSILESDGISSDPFEVLCHMGILIVEGRIPKSIGDSAAPSETGAKTAKPYNEGPHCPIFMKLYNKDPHNVHKCTENNMLCIRYNNFKQNLQSLQQKSPSICIEVSLGPDCLCGELRSQSTLVSTQPSKRDIVLEQWTITIGHKQMQEPSSQMSVLNLYQAVRSLLHFSQLTAWYMSHQGAKPSHVIYRVVTPEDSTFISDDNFVNHDFPVADVNKMVWMKISVKTLPRMEKIPTVFCPQHSSAMVDGAPSSHFEGKEPQKYNKEKSFLSTDSLHSKFSTENKEELLECFPLKFQGVRKKTEEAQERKRKKHITLYDSPPPLEINESTTVEFFDGIPMGMKKMSPEKDTEYYGNKRMFQGESMKLCLGETSKAEFKKSKSSAFPTDILELVKPQLDFKSFDTFSCNYFEQKVVDPTLDLMIGLKSFSDSKNKSDFRTKCKIKSSSNSMDSSFESVVKKKLNNKTVMDILDDRMQISCAISGKHHCKWEFEEESDLSHPGENVEKPKRRRSLSKVRANEGFEELKLGGSDSEKILHGKFKEVDCRKSDSCSPFRESENDDAEEGHSSALKGSPNCSQSSVTVHLESPPKPKSNLYLDIINNLLETTSNSETPKIESLPFKEMSGDLDSCGETCETKKDGSSRKEKTPDREESLNWIRTESFESFKKGCISAKESATECSSESEAELSESALETSNPFLAAILRTSRKSKKARDSKKVKICDNSIKNNLGSNEKANLRVKNRCSVEKLKNSTKCFTSEKILNEKAKAIVDEKVQSKNPVRDRRLCCENLKSGGKNLDLKSSRKKSAQNWNFEEATFQKFSSRNLNRLKNIFGNEDLNHEEKWECELFDETGSNNFNCTKTIPVPSAQEKMKFRRSLDSAAQLVFHRCSGLPLTSSPAPVRRNNSSFSFDSSLNSVSAIKSALFEPSTSLSSEDENESEGSLKSPASPGAWSMGSKLINYHSLSPLPLLGSFEESVLNGRLEPVSTVQGFTAELGASGSFCPRHLHLPVTVFFYTLGDNDKVSAPYLGHINLGKKGYNVPRSGTIQVTLFNPMRTVVKMFVVVYDLHDMPVNSHTFLRQRTLYVPASQKESTYTDKKKTPFDQEDYHKYLRYLIHLRFVSGKTGRIYLHTDIRMVIFRKADEDTATALGNQSDGESYELRSHTHGPMNPKFSPRK